MSGSLTKTKFIKTEFWSRIECHIYSKKNLRDHCEHTRAPLSVHHRQHIRDCFVDNVVARKSSYHP